MDSKDSNSTGDQGYPDAIAFRAAMRDDPAVPLSRDPSDEGGPVSVGRIDLGYPFEDANVLAELFLDDFPTVARIGPSGVVHENSRPSKVAARVAAQGAPVIEAKPRRCFIEVLLVGHLPVLGSAWVGQYAKHVAQNLGEPVGLIRLSGGDASIDLALPPSVVPPQTGPMPTVADALRLVGSKASRWVIRVDDAADLASPSDLAQSIHACDRVTVLTGADEAAVVGCYRVIKTLKDGESTPTLHVAVMGTAGERAGEAAAKLSKAAEKFLGGTVTSEACSPRITPGSSVNVYRGRPNVGHVDLIDLIRRLPGQAAELSGQRPAETPAPAHSTVPVAYSPASPDPAHPETSPAEAAESALDAVLGPDPEAVEFLEEPAQEIFVEPSRDPAPKPARAAIRETPAPAPSPYSQTSSHMPTLAGHIGGLQSLPTNCPYAPGVELALDSTGRLHLLARTTQAEPGSTLALLTTARDWALAHASLLSLGHRGMTQEPAVCHLMTDSPKSVRRLGDSELKLHLLTGSGDRWVCVELN
ncbi:MAG: hypothetical protein U0573_15590 [Phycisphaerales bacterium]|nr:hypothetical protein [Planctomycetota bacterium]